MTGNHMTYQGPIEADIDLTTPDAQAVLSGETTEGTAQEQTKPPATSAQPVVEVDAKTGQFIPRTRLNQVIEQRNAVQVENEAHPSSELPCLFQNRPQELHI